MSGEVKTVVVPVSALQPFINWPIGPEMIEDRDLIIHSNAGRLITVGDVLALRDAAAPSTQPGPRTEGEVVAWRSPEETPSVKAGDYAYRIVAVRRAHRSEVYSFGAYYLNGVSLWFEDDNGHREITGWNSDKGDDEPLYEPLLGAGDELLGWCDFPLFASPPQAVRGDGPFSQEAKIPSGVNLATVASSLDSIATKISDGSVNCSHAKYVRYAASVLERMIATPDASQPLSAAPEGV